MEENQTIEQLTKSYEEKIAEREKEFLAENPEVLSTIEKLVREKLAENS